MQKKIPKSFTLRGQKYTIHFNEKPHREDAIGLASLLKNRIDVAKTYMGEPIAKGQQRATMWHEVAHILLYAMDEHELNDNEKFVNQLGTSLGEVFDSIA